ncbi:MAG: hypothetical protein IJS03_04160 [Eubacterium sp.]|nr:hypothetical protein [Eubacterium sp.]
MKKELNHFYIGSSYGGNQEWFSTFFMRLGGCAAETACDMCIYLDKYKSTSLYPFDKDNVTRADYVRFSNIMKPYLHPRMSGIDRLGIYIDGFGEYLKSAGARITLSGVEGSEDSQKAKADLRAQLDSDIPVPFLCLLHENSRYKEYEWHWFLINGYENAGDKMRVKAVTYSEWEWLDFDELWNTNRAKKGGFIVLNLNT